jgi:hypothetical protein
LIPRRRNWIWFFAVLVLLAVIAIWVQIWHSGRQQLTFEQLAHARDLWKAKGPANYDMNYEIHVLDSTDRYSVRVRGGKAIAVTRNDQPVEQRQFRYSDMPALFGFIEDFLEQDSQPGTPRTFATASFDPTDGHLQRYVRSVMSKRERQEILVTQFLPRTGDGAS